MAIARFHEMMIMAALDIAVTCDGRQYQHRRIWRRHHRRDFTFVNSIHDGVLTIGRHARPSVPVWPRARAGQIAGLLVATSVSATRSRLP